MDNIEACKTLGIPYSSANLYYRTYNPSIERTCIYLAEQIGYRPTLRLLYDSNPPPTFRALIEKIGFENLFIGDYQYMYDEPFFIYPTETNTKGTYDGTIVIFRNVIVKSEFSTGLIRCSGEIPIYSIIDTAFPQYIPHDYSGRKVEITFPAIDIKYDINIDAGCGVLQSSKEIIKIYNKIVASETLAIPAYLSALRKLHTKYPYGSLKCYIARLKTMQDRIRVTNALWKLNIPKTKTIHEFTEIFDKLNARTIGVFDIALLQSICKVIDNYRYQNSYNIAEILSKAIE